MGSTGIEEEEEDEDDEESNTREGHAWMPSRRELLSSDSTTSSLPPSPQPTPLQREVCSFGAGSQAQLTTASSALDPVAYCGASSLLGSCTETREGCTHGNGGASLAFDQDLYTGWNGCCDGWVYSMLEPSLVVHLQEKRSSSKNDNDLQYILNLKHILFR